MYCVIIISSGVRIHNVPKNLLWVIFTAQNYWIPTFSRNICLNVSRQRAWWSLLFAWLRNQFRQSSEHSLSRATQRHRVSTCSRFRPTAYNKEITATSYSVISFLMKILYHSRILYLHWKLKAMQKIVIFSYFHHANIYIVHL